MKIEKINKKDFTYYQEKVLPQIDNINISEVHEVNREEKIKFIQKARCLIFPIQWEEPFGLVMTEAMSCGTPVVAFARGSVPEVVVDGVTGFLVPPKEGAAGMILAVEKLYGLTDSAYQSMRVACRKHVAENFTVERMVTGYEEVYKKILGI